MNLLTLDQHLTLAINALHSPFGDTFFWLFTKMEVWLPMFAVLIVLLWRGMGCKRALIIVAGAAVALLLADQTCNLIKLTVCRLRPSHDPNLAPLIHTVNGYLGGDYGFCSSHAANTMALLLFTSLIIRRWQYIVTMATWVLISCWSRIYLGVHYVGDILAGLLVGTLSALLIYLLYRQILNRLPQPPVETEHAPSLTNDLTNVSCTPLPVETEHAPSLTNTTANILVASYFATLLILLIYTLLTFQ